MSRPDTYLEKRLAQCLVQGVKTAFIGKRLLGLDGQIGLKLAEKMTGGLWLNGEVFLTNDAVLFLPSIIDRTMVKSESLPVLSLALFEISDISFRKGALTRILDIKSDEVTLSFRGLGMDSFAESVQAQRK